MEIKVVGVKRWRGTLDGKSIDSAKLFAEVRMDDSRNGSRDGNDGFAAGIAFEELKLPGGSFCLPIESYLNSGGKLPVLCDITVERVSNGKVVRELVTGVRVVDEKTGELLGGVPAQVKPLKGA